MTRAISLALIFTGCVSSTVPPANNSTGGGGGGDSGTAFVEPTPSSTEPTHALLKVDFAGDAGPVPALFRLGVQINAATDEVNQQLAAEHHLGHLRFDLGYSVLSPATSPADAVARVEKSGLRAQLANARDAGIEVTVNLVETPRALSSCANETRTEPISGWPSYSTCPPADLPGWEAMVRAIVGSVEPGQLWEVWNEPDGAFWRGTPEQFFALYTATARAILQVDPSARIGGPTVSSVWAGTTPQNATPGFIHQFLRWCATHPIAELGLSKTPVDFVVWHQFGMLPAPTEAAINAVRGWVTDAGYPASTPLSIDEWNLQTESSPPGGLSDPFHSDSEFGAAWAVRSLLSMQRAGLDRHAFSALGDWSHDPPEFHGGQGLTSSSGLRKPVWNALRLVGLLRGQLVPVQLGGDAPLVDAIASKSGDEVLVIVVNSVPDWRYGMEQFLGLEHAADTAAASELSQLPPSELQALLVDFTRSPQDLKLSVTAQTLAKDAVARSHLLTEGKRTVSATIELSNLPPGLTRLRRYVIDAKSNNAYRAYLAAGNTTAALLQARAAMNLQPAEDRPRAGSRSEALNLTLERDAVVALRLSAP